MLKARQHAGLTDDGCIPANKPCPFLEYCRTNPLCPNPKKLYAEPMSCGLARALAMESYCHRNDKK